MAVPTCSRLGVSARVGRIFPHSQAGGRNRQAATECPALCTRFQVAVHACSTSAFPMAMAIALGTVWRIWIVRSCSAVGGSHLCYLANTRGVVALNLGLQCVRYRRCDIPNDQPTEAANHENFYPRM